ncbi:PfkB family carbohydrate kinase [soil metagenome]
MTASAPRVVVIGGANVDVIARPHVAAVAATSNPGRVTVTPGGVGRNIAEGLARLGTRTDLVATVGSDAHGDLVVSGSAAAGVGVDHVRRVLAATGTYVALLDEGGEMVSAVSDMAATAQLGPADVAPTADLVAVADLLVLDGNLSEEALRAAWDLGVASGVRVVIDPVSVPKAVTVGRLLGPDRPLYLLSAGSTELVAIAGLDGAAAAHARGVELLWERAGSLGSRLSTSRTHHDLEARGATVVDVTGAGDAMLAGFCHAHLAGAGPVEAATYGDAVAALTVTSRHTVRPDLSDGLVRSLL